MHLDFYNFKTSHVKITFYKSQRQYVKEAKKLTYSNRVVVVFAKIQIINLKKTSFSSCSRRKKKEIVLLNYESYVNVEIFLVVVCFELKVFNSFKKQKFIRKFFKKRIKKKNNSLRSRCYDLKN